MAVHAPQIKPDTIWVIARADNSEYQEGYMKILVAFPKIHVMFETETNPFAVCLNDTLNMDSEWLDRILFLVDDCLFLRPMPGIPPSECVFSLRLGHGIKGWDSVAKRAKLHKFQSGSCRAVVWRENYDNTPFTYPFSVDGHFLPWYEIRTMVNLWTPLNPNNFEVQGHGHRRDLPSTMAYFETPVVVNISINRVSTSSNTSHSDVENLNEKTLNDAYLSGKTLDWRQMATDATGHHLTHYIPDGSKNYI